MRAGGSSLGNLGEISVNLRRMVVGQRAHLAESLRRLEYEIGHLIREHLDSHREQLALDEAVRPVEQLAARLTNRE